MRVIGYVNGIETPAIEHLNRLENLEIIGGRFLDNGDLALACKHGSKDFVCMVYPKPFPGSLHEAMEQRAREMEREEDVFHTVFADILHQRTENTKEV